MKRYEFIHDDRIARRGALVDATFSAQEYSTLVSLKRLNVHMRHFFKPEAQINMALLREMGVKIDLYINLLHVPRVMEVPETGWDHDWATLHSGAISQWMAWKAKHGGPDLYWCDPTKLTPDTVSEFLLARINEAQFKPDGIFCDHAIERPWVFVEWKDERGNWWPASEPLLWHTITEVHGRSLTDEEWPNSTFRSWQLTFATDLLRAGQAVYVNGRWPLDYPVLWGQDVTITGKEWEMAGNRWAAWRGWRNFNRKVMAWSDLSVEHIIDLRGHVNPLDGDVKWYEKFVAEWMSRVRPNVYISRGNLL